MTDPFAPHGITNLSASQINQFASSPALWVLERVLKRRSPVGSAAHRGTACEEGIVAGLQNQGLTADYCAEIALAKFRSLTALSRDPNREKEQQAIPGIVAQGLKELRPYGIPSQTQGKIEYRFDGLSIPLIGYYDLLYDDHGMVIDIKTQLRLASEIKQGHARQVAIYKAGLGNDNLDARISYITDKRAATYQLENHREHAEALRKIALTMQRFVALSRDPMELVGLVAPDYDHFFWNDPVARQNGFETWGY